MKKSVIWVHAGAYGELKALLPILDQLHEKYSQLEFCLSTNMQEVMDLDLKRVRSYLDRKPFILREADLGNLHKMISTIRPVLWISSSFFIESHMLFLCSIFNIPVVYIFEGFMGVFPKPINSQRARFIFRTTRGLVSQREKRDQFEQLGMDSERIFQLKSLKWILGVESVKQNLDCSEHS